MKLVFTEEQIKQELNKFYLEEDDLLMEGEFVTGEGKNYVITGIATIEGERYHEFEIEFELLQEPAEMTLEAIMAGRSSSLPRARCSSSGRSPSCSCPAPSGPRQSSRSRRRAECVRG